MLGSDSETGSGSQKVMQQALCFAPKAIEKTVDTLRTFTSLVQEYRKQLTAEDSLEDKNL